MLAACAVVECRETLHTEETLVDQVAYVSEAGKAAAVAASGHNQRSADPNSYVDAMRAFAQSMPALLGDKLKAVGSGARAKRIGQRKRHVAAVEQAARRAATRVAVCAAERYPPTPPAAADAGARCTDAADAAAAAVANAAAGASPLGSVDAAIDAACDDAVGVAAAELGFVADAPPLPSQRDRLMVVYIGDAPFWVCCPRSCSCCRQVHNRFA